jgi:aminopeptidase N
MKISYCFLGFLMMTIGFSQSKQKESPFLDNGVSEQLARFRKHQISNVTYGLSFEIPNKKEEEINARLILDLTLSDLSDSLFFRF